jgi:hypothetical protein
MLLHAEAGYAAGVDLYVVEFVESIATPTLPKIVRHVGNLSLAGNECNPRIRIQEAHLMRIGACASAL